MNSFSVPDHWAGGPNRATVSRGLCCGRLRLLLHRLLPHRDRGAGRLRDRPRGETEPGDNRRTINTEEKARVLTAVWGTAFIQLIVALTRTILIFGWIAPGWFERKGWIHPILQIVLVQNIYHRKEMNKFCPPNSSDDLCLFFCIYPSSMLETL